MAAIQTAGCGKELREGVAAMAVEALIQLAGPGDHASRRCGTWSVRRIDDPDEPIPFAILYSLDAGSDVGAVKPVQSTMDRSARHAFLGAGSGPKDHVPMSPLVQAWKVVLPNFVV